MNIHHSDLDINGTATPTHLYLLPVDSSANLGSNDSQVFPIHIFNNTSDYGRDQFFLPIQSKGQCQDQLEVFIDPCQSAVKYASQQVDKSYQQSQQELIPISQIHSIPSDLQCAIFEPALVNRPDKPTKVTQNTRAIQDYVHISDRNVLPRALAVLPTVLCVRRKDIISPRRSLAPRTRFGPVQGVKHKISDTEASELVFRATENRIPLFLKRDEEDNILHIDVSDKDKSNWISLLPLGDENTANVWIYEDNKELYIITTETIPCRQQLMLGYSTKYAQNYGLIGPTKDIEAEFMVHKKSWWCFECQRAMTSASLLRRHIDTFHQEFKANTRRRYCCRYCTLKFGRLFTLRRHMARHCKRKVSKSDNIISTETLPDNTLNSTLNTEDNRVPSDESFQNYSNGLDFPTNLFDTDRMPSLDISGNSRSEVFNPYTLDSESPLTHDLGYINGCSSKSDISPDNSDKKKKRKKDNPDTSSVPCPYCNKHITKGKKRQHVSECPGRRFECECKKVFPNKELLARHIYTQHSNEKEAEEQAFKDENNVSSAIAMTYKCEECALVFKRRGILVNHLWREHKMAATRVPLETRVRHYPCPACPKIYRTASKRDLHVKVHHPGADKIRLKPMEGGTRPCTPAACSACPRQYATRAKLLQHQRQHHPDLAPPPQRRSNLTRNPKNKTNRVNSSKETAKSKTSFIQLFDFN